MFTPYVAPAQPPAGVYDPSLDAAQGAVDRGLAYTTQDVQTAGSRAETDYGIQKHGLTTQRDNSLADLLRGHTRAGEDFSRSSSRLGEDYSTGTTRLGEDHTTNLQGIDRGYQRLGVSQAGAANQRGVATQGSTLAASLRARRENQGIDVAAEDRQFGRGNEDLTRGFNRGTEDLTRGFNRGTEDITTAQTREGQDYGTNTQRTTDAYNDPTYGLLAQADTGYQRGVDDRATQLGRAGVEATQFGLDTNTQRNFQAQQVGYQAPAKPSNEFSDAKGPYKLQFRGNRRYRIRPDGTEEFAGVRA